MSDNSPPGYREFPLEDRGSPSDLHPQDWLIIEEALAEWVGPPENHHNLEGRQARALAMMGMIQEFIEMHPVEGKDQVDESWSGPDE